MSPDSFTLYPQLQLWGHRKRRKRYGTGEQRGRIKEGHARYLADALPNARRIGFTGTPISFSGANTVEVFGEVIHTYDIKQSQEDHATVKIFYAPRQIQLHLNRKDVDAALVEIAQGHPVSDLERRKSQWAALAAAAGAKDRMEELAKDLLAHFLDRSATLDGKAMVVCMTRANCVKLYDELMKLPGCPEIKVVMTGNLGEDPPEWARDGHLTTKGQRDIIKKRMVDVDDPPGPLPLYRGDSIGKAGPVVVVEGEKCVDAAVSVGLVAVTSAHGGEGAQKSDWSLLTGREVIILPDNDDTGRKYAQEVATILSKLTPPVVVKIVTLPGLGEHGDIADWVSADGPMGDKEADDIRATILNMAKAATAWTPPAKVTGHVPVLTCLATVKPVPVRWLWPSRIASGKLTMISGDPGLGKSFITLDMAARVSTGTAWPDCATIRNTPGGIVLLSAEDDLADTIRPRLDAAKADVSRIHAFNTVRAGVNPDTGKPIFEAFNLVKHLPMLEAAIQQVADCRLVILDPISSYLGGTDSHKNADVRGVLAPLSELAARHGVAIVAVNHLRKGEGRAIHRSMGSMAFVAAARAAYVVTEDSEDPTGCRRLVLPVKNNVGNDQTGLAYRLIAEDGGMAAVTWESEPVIVSADEAMSVERPSRGDDDDGTARHEAAAWLLDALEAGPVAAKEIYTRAAKDGISKRTLLRAKVAIGAVAGKTGFGAAGAWCWKLPHRPDSDGQAIDRPAPETIGPGSQPVATFGGVGNLCAESEEDRGPQVAPETPAAKDCQPPETGNVRLCRPTGELDPNRPGPTDLLTQTQYERYRAVYNSRSSGMPPSEKHARAWRAALRPA